MAYDENAISWHGQQALKGLSADEVRRRLSYDPITGIFVRKAAEGLSSKQNGFAGKVTGTPNNHGYLRICLDGVSYKAHRLAWLYHYGEWPADTIDHINGNKGDNRIENLRVASHIQNKRNVSVRCISRTGLKGVTQHTQCKNKWIARIRGRDGVQRHIGIFNNPEDAAEAYRKAALREHGRFAKID